MDARLLTFTVWGLGTVLVYGIVFARRARSWRLHHDSRARRDLLVAGALFATSFASALSIAMVLFGAAGTAPRSVLIAISLGAYLGAGIVMVTEHSEADPADGSTDG